MFRVSILSVFTILLALSGCFTKVTNHGYPEDKAAIEKLQIGVTTKAVALDSLGEPTTYATFDNDIWYYISTVSEAKGFLKAKITHDQVIQLQFKNDKLKEVKFTDNKDNREIIFNKDKSIVGGDDGGMLKDFFHNFGRFNKALNGKR